MDDLRAETALVPKQELGNEDGGNEDGSGRNSTVVLKTTRTPEAPGSWTWRRSVK